MQVVVRLQTQLTAAGCCSTHTLPPPPLLLLLLLQPPLLLVAAALLGLVMDAPAKWHTQVSAQTHNTTVQHIQQAASCDLVAFTRCCPSACRRWQARPCTGLQSPAHLPALLFCWKQTAQPAPVPTLLLCHAAKRPGPALALLV